MLPAINLKLGVEFSKNLLVTLDSAFYPYLFITSVDNHHYRKIQFVDIMNGGNGFYISLSAEYKKFILQLGYFYLQVQKMGESKMYTIGEKVAAQKLSDFPGTTDFMFYMSVKYRIN